jgi:hypothetical protein
MAGRDHNLTRRAVLGAAFAVPALGGTGVGSARQKLAPAPPPPQPSPIKGEGVRRRWRRARVALDRAEADLDAFCGGCRDGALTFADQAALDDAFGDRLGAFYAALRRLLRTPAPDFDALTVKIALAVDHEVGTLTGGERCLAALKADARRLGRA